VIVGVGIDILAVERMESALAEHGRAFLDHIFTPEEIEAAPSGAGRAAYFAGRWAAKEALAKALGTGIGAQCRWRDITVRRGANGRPKILLTGAAAETARTLGAVRIQTSISHTRLLACAVVVLETDGPDAAASSGFAGNGNVLREFGGDA